MKNKITIRPDKIKLFSQGKDNANTFCLITNPFLVSKFHIQDSTRYSRTIIVPFDNQSNIANILKNEVPEEAHIVFISPEVYADVHDDDIQNKQKIIVMSAWETFASEAAIQHFCKMLEKSDPLQQKVFSDKFFEKGGTIQQLNFVDSRYDTSAKFNHLHDDYEWHELCGILENKSQFRDCGGEVAVTPVEFSLTSSMSDQVKLEINGEIILNGYPVLQNSREIPSIQADQDRLYQGLATLKEGAILAIVSQGVITDIKVLDESAKPAADVLELLFQIDSRHRILYEIGFGFNTEIEIFDENIGFNETYGGKSGVVHFGLGSRLTTQYHLDILCPNTSVVSDKNEFFFGKKSVLNAKQKDSIGKQYISAKKKFSPKKSSHCPCMKSI